ncbi:MAG: hypothetical protein WD555_02375 [Fulvivirga sp.]
MSDFIYSRKAVAHGTLSKEIQKIYHKDKVPVNEYHGIWGSLAVSHNLYKGFRPYETREHIFIVIGGPVLAFRDNQFLTKGDEVEGSKAIYNNWIANDIHWDEDLSGPFAILIINKSTAEIICVSDLMSFIPVYLYQNKDNFMLSTHTDVLARASKQEDKADLISKVDFILHGVVTYPYTCYANLRQLAPATMHTFSNTKSDPVYSAYWIPEEKNLYKSIDKAAGEARYGLQTYVNAVVEGMSHIAQFITGGEDSRTISGLLPRRCKRDAFVFLEAMNLEGKIAKKAAEAYGANFNISIRTKIHYLEILPACSDLVGSGSEYRHVHAYGFHETCNLNNYPAIFGGLFSDALLKGSRIEKSRNYGFLPQIKNAGYSPVEPYTYKYKIFSTTVMDEVTERRQAYLSYIKTLRPESAEEWFQLWPSSMNKCIPNIHGNRRLFRSYEPFLAKEVVKTSAGVPQKWKLNRRLFHKVTKPFHISTKWLFHSDGRLPYFPWYVNNIVSFPTKVFRKIRETTGLAKSYDGAWYDWEIILASKEWENTISKYSGGIKEIESLLEDKNVLRILQERHLDGGQKANLVQDLHINQMNRNILYLS